VQYEDGNSYWANGRMRDRKDTAYMNGLMETDT